MAPEQKTTSAFLIILAIITNLEKVFLPGSFLDRSHSDFKVYNYYHYKVTLGYAR